MANFSNWMLVDLFTIDQAAALWSELDPGDAFSSGFGPPSEVIAAKQMLISAIVAQELTVNSTLNSWASVGNYSKSLVKRSDLEELARRKKVFPAFLFDTILPFAGEDPFGGSAPKRVTVASGKTAHTPQTNHNKGGRPPEHDWNTFHLEIVRLADSPDGLPDTQADLIRTMLEWFQENYGREPAESAVKDRISKIYKYIEKAKNPPE